MKKKSYLKIGILFFMILLLITPVVVMAQGNDAITITMSKDWGYNSFFGQIQGTFSIKANGPKNLIRVIFFLDGEVLAVVTKAPFKYQFRTENYSLGVHKFIAIGYTEDGIELTSREILKEFVSHETGWKSTLKIIGPVLAVILVTAALPFLIGMISGRKQGALPLGAERSYLLGGTICPKCSRPFGIHIWGLNMVIGKLDRCPHCGKWSLVRRLPIETLHAAEQAELEGTKKGEATPQVKKEEEIKKKIDDSKYMGI